MNKDEKARFKTLAEQYGLSATDFWKSPQGFVIISRRGIEKIQEGLKVNVSFEVVPEFTDVSNNVFVVKAIGEIRNEVIDGERINDKGQPTLTRFQRVKRVETYGESSPKNTRGGAQAYPVAMAEKRALSRCVLKLSDMYSLNVFSEDEVSE